MSSNSKTELVSARVDPEVKKEAEAILDALGISVSAAINSLYRQIIMQRGLPYRLTVPYEQRAGSGLTPETPGEQDENGRSGG